MLPHVDYLLIGHVTADLTPTGRILGGTVSFGARVAHAFGKSVGVLTSAAQDEPLLAELEPYARIVSKFASNTSTFENIYDEIGGRKQYIRSVADRLTANDIPETWLTAPLVHLGPLTNEVDPNIVRLFPDSTILLTPQGWLRQWSDNGLVQFRRWYDPDVLSSVDIVVFSEADIVEAPELEQEFAHAVEYLIVTRGELGGTLYYRGQEISYNTGRVEVKDETGAGDIFASTLLSCLSFMPKSDIQISIKIAAQIATNSVTRLGIEGAPTPAEVQEALKRHFDRDTNECD